MGISYSPFLNAETGVACKNFKTAEVPKFWTDNLIEIDVLEKKKPKLGLLPEKESMSMSVLW